MTTFTPDISSLCAAPDCPIHDDLYSLYFLDHQIGAPYYLENLVVGEESFPIAHSSSSDGYAVIFDRIAKTTLRRRFPKSEVGSYYEDAQGTSGWYAVLPSGLEVYHDDGGGTLTAFTEYSVRAFDVNAARFQTMVLPFTDAIPSAQTITEFTLDGEATAGSWAVNNQANRTIFQDAVEAAMLAKYGYTGKVVLYDHDLDGSTAFAVLLIGLPDGATCTITYNSVEYTLIDRQKWGKADTSGDGAFYALLVGETLNATSYNHNIGFKIQNVNKSGFSLYAAPGVPGYDMSDGANAQTWGDGLATWLKSKYGAEAEAYADWDMNSDTLVLMIWGLPPGLQIDMELGGQWFRLAQLFTRDGNYATFNQSISEIDWFTDVFESIDWDDQGLYTGSADVNITMQDNERRNASISRALSERLRQQLLDTGAYGTKILFELYKPGSLAGANLDAMLASTEQLTLADFAFNMIFTVNGSVNMPQTYEYN